MLTFSFVMDYLIFSICLILLGIVVWAGICGLLESAAHLFRPFLLLKSPLRSQLNSSSSSFYVTLSFFFPQLKIVFLCSVRLVFWLLCAKETFFSGPDYSYILYFVFFLYFVRHLLFMLGKISSMIWLKIFSVSLTHVSSPSSIPIILTFGFS